MRKTTVGAAAIASALIASVTLVSSGSASAETTADSTTAHRTTSGQAVAQTGLPVLVDPAGDLSNHPDRVNQSWYVTAHVTAGGHRYGFLAHYLNADGIGQGVSLSSVSITDEETGWYTKSEAVLPTGTGLSDKEGVDIQTENITWTGDVDQMTLHAKVPEGTIDVTLSPRGNVLYNMGAGAFPMFGDANSVNYEYALPSMDTSGTLTLNGRTTPVVGQSWLDRQWGPMPDFTTADAGWAWMNLNLSNGDKVSVWNQTYGDKKTNFATVLKPDGSQTVTNATLTPDKSTLWTSPTSGKSYPTRWKVSIPSEDADLDVKVYAKDQELPLTGPRYEGTASVKGTYDHRSVTGVTYIEVTG